MRKETYTGPPISLTMAGLEPAIQSDATVLLGGRLKPGHGDIAGNRVWRLPSLSRCLIVIVQSLRWYDSICAQKSLVQAK